MKSFLQNHTSQTTIRKGLAKEGFLEWRNLVTVKVLVSESISYNHSYNNIPYYGHLNRLNHGRDKKYHGICMTMSYYNYAIIKDL